PHEYIRSGTAKVMTLFHPADGHVHLQGVTTCPNQTLHGWLKERLCQILAELAPRVPCAWGTEWLRTEWERWQEGLTLRPTLPVNLPPLRMLLVLDNLAGHKTPAFVCWLFAHGV